MLVTEIYCNLSVFIQVLNGGTIGIIVSSLIVLLVVVTYYRRKIDLLQYQSKTDSSETNEKSSSTYDLLLHVYNSRSTCFWGTDLVKKKTIYISPGVETVYGYSQEDFINNNNLWFEILVEEDRKIFDESYQKLNVGEVADLEFRIRTKDKSMRWLEVRITPTLDVNRKLIRLDGTTFDISARKSVEEVLKVNMMRLDEAQRIAHIGSWELHHASGRIYWSEEIYRIFELDPDSTSPSYEHFLDLVHPDDKQYVDLEYSNSIRNHTAYDIVHRIIFGDGRIKYLHEQCETQYDRHGNPLVSIGTVQDVTERQLSEMALAESENRLQTIVRTGPDCIKLTDRNNHLVDMNLSGVEMIEAESLEQIKGKSVLPLVNEPFQEKYKKMTEHIFSGGTGVLEYEITGLKGGKKWLESHSVPMKNKNGEIVSMLCVTHDVTARKKAEEEIRKSNEDLRQLAAHIEKIREEERLFISREIHDELGQQLTAMKMDTTWISKKLVGTDRMVDSKLSSLIQMMDTMVKTIRKISSELRPSELEHLGLRTTLELHAQEFERRTGIKVLFSSGINQLTVCPEISIALFRIFQESLTNIARHSGAKKVKSSLEHENDKLILQIEDDGIGFSPLQQYNQKTLGILGMRERALLLGGDYKIVGNEGKGTFIEVTIPLKSESPVSNN